VSRQKTERLLNLVVCLLATRRYLTAAQIRHAVSGYPDGDESFKRMFERDKEELRELGIPLEVGSDDEDGADGYRIRRQDYELPELHLSPDEAAVLGLAARVWRRASLADAAAGALLKLRAAGVDTGETPSLGVEPRLGVAEEPAFPTLWRAVADRRPVAFDYQAVGRSAPTRRRLEPWGVVNRRGRWYVAGYDRDREDVRVFRLSRIRGEVTFAGRRGSVVVPENADARQIVAGNDEPVPDRRTAAVLLRRDAAWGVRRWAREIRPYAAGGEDAEQWDECEVGFYDVEWLADFLAPFAADVMVLDPPDARDALIQRLKAALA
jgi:proteasome accessory factor B